MRFGSLLITGTALLWCSSAVANQLSASPEGSGRFEMIFTGQTDVSGGDRVYRVDITSGESSLLRDGDHWVKQDNAMAPGHYQVLATGSTLHGQAQILLLNTDTGATWRMNGNAWQPI